MTGFKAAQEMKGNSKRIKNCKKKLRVHSWGDGAVGKQLKGEHVTLAFYPRWRYSLAWSKFSFQIT